MMRRLFAILSAVSLLLCVGTCALWVRSLMASSFNPMSFTAFGRLWAVGLVDRSVKVLSADGWPSDRPHTSYWYIGIRVHRDRELAEGLGYRSNSSDALVVAADGQPYPAVYRNLTVYLWLPTSVTAIATIAWLLYALPANGWARAAGRCPACGYDLRATPGRCP